jgi:predicted amino acid racemase
MTAPRLEINLEKIRHNAHTLVNWLEARGISVTGVTKAALGAPEIAGVLLEAGVKTLGDSRIENIQSMQHAGIPAPMTMIRSPMLSQADEVVAHCDISFNTELEVISTLSTAAGKAGRTHGVLLMVELGDLREGIMPGDLEDTVRQTLSFPNIAFRGIGTNLGCRSGVSPDRQNMAELSALADSIDATFGPIVDIVSGGNSGNLSWALSAAPTGRINNLRLGEALLLGVEPLHRQHIDGLYTDAFTLVAEVIEAKIKPSQPWGTIAQTAFGESPPAIDRGDIPQAILAIGRQDIDPSGLFAPAGITILGASSDHLIVGSDDRPMPIGAEITFNLNYSALLRAMSSIFVAKVMQAVVRTGDQTPGWDHTSSHPT